MSGRVFSPMGANVTELYYFGVGVVGIVCHLYSPFCVFEEKKL
jgi:hypothetical protein